MEDTITFKNNLLDQRYTMPKHLGISSRMVTYWKTKHILPFFQAHKNGRMNVPQAVWLYLIQELSEFGINTTKLAELAYLVWQVPREQGYFKQKLEKAISYLERQNDSDTDEVLKTYKRNIKDHLLLDTLGQEINPFVDAIVDSILINKNPLSFYYFPKSGECYVRDGNALISEKLIGMIKDEAYLCIPLMGFVKSIVSVEFEYVKRDLNYLSQVENQIREIIMFKSPKHIELLVDDHSIKPLIIREEHKKAEQLANFFLNNKLPKTARLLIEPRAQGNYKLTILTK